MTKKKILFVARDTGGCGYFRCKQPADFIKRTGIFDTEFVIQTVTKEQMLDADLVIFQDTGTVNGSNNMKFCYENRIPFLTEFDDFIQHVSPHNDGGYSCWNPGTLFTHRAMNMSRMAFGMTVSTPQLAREYDPYSSRIYVIPNYLDKEKWDNPVVKRVDGKIRIGWCGGNAHADDLKMVSLVLDKIVKEYKGKVIFETMGMTGQELQGVFPMKLRNDVCSECGYEGEMHHYPGEDLENYPIVLATRGWDIVIAPILNTAFNNCKSDLKIKEYAALGYPVVASLRTPYLEANKNGAEMLFADTFDEWYNSIKELIENTEKRDEMAKKNKVWIQNYWIQDNVIKLTDIYSQVISLAEQVLGTKEGRLIKK